MRMLIPIALIALPLLEIATFVAVGSQIGVLATVGLVILTTVLGGALLRIQGFGVLGRIREEVEAGRTPGRELAHGEIIVLAGVLLLLPGFITDALGLLLFIPPVRDAAWRLLKGRITIVTSVGPRAGFGFRNRGHDENTIDLDADDYSRTPDPDSPWRRREIE